MTEKLRPSDFVCDECGAGPREFCKNTKTLHAGRTKKFNTHLEDLSMAKVADQETTYYNQEIKKLISNAPPCEVHVFKTCLNRYIVCCCDNYRALIGKEICDDRLIWLLEQKGFAIDKVGDKCDCFKSREVFICPRHDTIKKDNNNG